MEGELVVVVTDGGVVVVDVVVFVAELADGGDTAVVEETGMDGVEEDGEANKISVEATNSS